MSLIPAQSLVHLHADVIKEADTKAPEAQIKEPEPDDAAASPSLFEALEQALWQGTDAQDEADEGSEVALPSGLDVEEALHCVAGITLDI